MRGGGETCRNCAAGETCYEGNCVKPDTCLPNDSVCTKSQSGAERYSVQVCSHVYDITATGVSLLLQRQETVVSSSESECDAIVRNLVSCEKIDPYHPPCSVDSGYSE